MWKQSLAFSLLELILQGAEWIGKEAILSGLTGSAPVAFRAGWA
jgi:hypothetical protein